MTTIHGTSAPVSAPLLSARALLVRGLVAGLVAGLLAFAVGFLVGEPAIDDAIALEESASAAPAASSETADHSHADGTATHSHDESTGEEAGGHSHGDEEEGGISRATQKGWGLLTATVVVGTALGGLVALVAAGVMGRLGRAGRRIRPTESVAFVALAGFVAVALVPFLKYPAAPPAVGSGDTIGSRTGLYFAFLLVSVVAAVAATYLGQRLWATAGAYAGVVGGVLAYVVVVGTAAALMPAVNELGDFPADVLWSFRLGSALTLTAMWAGIGVVLAGLVGRLHAQQAATQARRDLAASL
ncbi:CbtA family protein [Nocardioides alkalitolerans]|uniref:CbtA family protein n=1 Tax=Nocardioides alkalitolerans TaxID=281714 RepID=UPI000410399F|nr:CbtA family protein [Nocardioides alkalitolerans]